MVNVSVTLTEMRDQRSWFVSWLIVIFSFAMIIVLVYPGDEAMRDILDLFSDPLYESFLGAIGGEDPSYTVWHSLMGAFLGIIFSFYGLLAGVRISMKSIGEGTFEILGSLPQPRTSVLLSKYVAMFTYGIILILAWFVPTLVPFVGEALEFELVAVLAGWAMLYLAMALFFGILLGNLSGSSSRGLQYSILLVLILYIAQILINLQQDLLIDTEFWDYEKIISPRNADIELTTTVSYTLYNLLTDINFTSWYNPTNYMLGSVFEFKYLVIIAGTLILLAFLSIVTYLRKDLIDERGLLTIRIPWRRSRATEITDDDQAYVKPKRSVKSSIYVFWIRPFEKRFPFTADFVYSDKRILMILAFATILFWPLQLMAYTGDELAAGAATFASGGFFSVFTYGYDLSQEPPFAWWLITQALGIHWMLLVPMTIRWIRAVPSRDGEDGTGDLIGSLPIRKRDIVYQRLFGVFLELIWTSLWFVIWYILSLALIESRIGSVVRAADPENNITEIIFTFDNPYALEWVIIAIICLIPLYMFLTSLGVLVNLALKQRGLRYGRGIVLLFTLLFIAGFSTGNPDLFWLSGAFGMYNPVTIVRNETLAEPTYGVLVLIGLTILTLIVMRFNTKHFTWLKQDVKEFYEVYDETE